MQELRTIEDYKRASEDLKDLMVLGFCTLNSATSEKVQALLEELGEIYSPSVSFYTLYAQKFLSLFAKFQVSSVPSILFLSKDRYGSNEVIEKARLTWNDISKDNVIALVSEYKNDVVLK